MATYLPRIQTFSVNVPRAGIGTNLQLETVAKKRRVFLGTFPRGTHRASFVRKRASLALIPLVPLPPLESQVLRRRAGCTRKGKTHADDARDESETAVCPPQFTTQSLIVSERSVPTHEYCLSEKLYRSSYSLALPQDQLDLLNS